MEKLVFNADALPEASFEYVCWIDIMGIRNSMMCSVKGTANFIFKLHSIIIENLNNDIIAYPCMDGAYISVKTKKTLFQFLNRVFERSANEFIIEDSNYHKFIIRASVAYGPIIHGRDITKNVTNKFDGKDQYKQAILLGSPMIQAYSSENNAPPFGIYIHESARVFAPKEDTPFTYTWYYWLKYASDAKVKNDFKEKLFSYFEWAKKNSIKIDYPIERIEHHIKMVEQFFEE
jgi:hypothetical protein